MKSKKLWAFVLSALSLLGHGYLWWQHYSLKNNLTASESFCSINETFNCDAVALSQYSTFFNIPVALFGFMAHLFFIFLLLSYAFSSQESPKKYIRFAFGVSALIVVSSLVMGWISVAHLSTYCLVCIALYFLSFGMFELMRRDEDSSYFFKNLFSDLRTSFSLLVALVVFSGLSFLVHRQQNPEPRFAKLKPENIVRDWSLNKAEDFSNVKESFAIGASKQKASMVIKEFADFFCPACKKASYPISSFVQAYKDKVRLEYYSFPGGVKSCKSEYNSRCYVSMAAFCAEQVSQKGYFMSKEIFRNQREVIRLRVDAQAMEEKVRKMGEKLNIPWESLKSCLENPKTKDTIEGQLKKAHQLGLTVVPSIFVNGKLLSPFLGVELLNRIYTQKTP